MRQALANPKLPHEQAVKRIVRYLRATRDKGLRFNVDVDAGFECYADADFAGAFERTSSAGPKLCYSRTGYYSVWNDSLLPPTREAC